MKKTIHKPVESMNQWEARATGGVRQLRAGLVLEDFRSKPGGARLLTDGRAVPSVAQRVITGIASWAAFQAAYRERNDGDDPAAILEASVNQVIAEPQVYDYDQAFERAMDLATADNAGELEAHDCYVRVADLVPQLDPEQHRPDLVTYDEEARTLTQTATNDIGSTHYGQDRLENVMNAQLDEDEEQIESIFFEILNEDANVPITTGDGRHRIAVYHAMGVSWIRAAVTVSQRQTLVARGIAVADQPEAEEQEDGQEQAQEEGHEHAHEEAQVGAQEQGTHD
jgi:hypothetical protein